MPNTPIGLGASLRSSPTMFNAQSLTSGRVKIAVTNNTDYPEVFKNFGEWATIGCIFFEDINSPTETNSPYQNTIAYPLFPNSTTIPLINEIVYLVKLPNTQMQGNLNEFSYYYFQPINIWNSTHHNAIPDSLYNESIPESQQQDYEQTEAGIVRRVTDGSTEINLGNTFEERLDVRNLQPYEGDIIHQGRWGQSLRFGSSIPSPSPFNPWSNTGPYGSPITILRNGQTNSDEDPWIPQVEDINTDLTSIYLTSTQQIPIDAASKSYNSYDSPPESPSLYSSDQIILNSGRLLLNSKSDSILLSSFDTINLNSINSVNIDTPKTIVKSDEIYLGDKGATEPIILGNKFLADLQKLLTSLISLSSALATPIGTPVPFVPNASIPAPATDTLVKAQNMLNKIETYKSKVSKSK